MPDAAATARVRENMVAYGFPAKLLPDVIAANTLDEKTGAFTVTLERDFIADVHGHKVLYSKQIRGTIAQGKITNLSGVNVKVLLIKPAITEIRASDDKSKVSFSVAGLVQAVPWSAFT
jgi:hypothetical protein